MITHYPSYPLRLNNRTTSNLQVESRLGNQDLRGGYWQTASLVLRYYIFIILADCVSRLALLYFYQLLFLVKTISGVQTTPFSRNVVTSNQQGITFLLLMTSYLYLYKQEVGVHKFLPLPLPLPTTIVIIIIIIINILQIVAKINQ